METPDMAGAPVEAAPATSSIDLSPVLDRVNELAGSVTSLSEQFGQHFQQPEPEPEDPWAALYGDDPEPEPAQPSFDPNALQQAVQAAIDQGINSQVGPLQQQLAQLQNAQNLQKLMADHPELQDPEVRQQTGARASQLAEQIVTAQGYEPGVAGVLTNSPEFISLVRKAMAAEDSAAGEVPAGGEVNMLEHGGSVPAGQQDQPSIAAQVLANRKSLPKGLA